MSECIRERNGFWHVVAGAADEDATWRPILCGEGIVLPGNGYDREPTCPECVALSLVVRP